MVIIRDYKEEDLDIIYKIRNDDALQEKLMSSPKTETYEDVQNWVIAKQNKNILKVVALKTNNQCIGYMQLVDIDNHKKEGKLGIVIYNNYQNLGFGQKAITLFLEFLEKEFKLKKILLEVLSLNKNAIKVYENIGFIKVETIEKNITSHNKPLEVLFMEKILNEK